MVHNIFTHLDAEDRINEEKDQQYYLSRYHLDTDQFRLLTSCATKSAIVGAWRLVESEDPAYTRNNF